MSKRSELPLERSAMFSILLDVDPGFGRLDSRAGSRRVTEAVEAWLEDDGADMHRFARRWSRENPL